jgi:hypothetical protein
MPSCAFSDASAALRSSSGALTQCKASGPLKSSMEAGSLNSTHLEKNSPRRRRVVVVMFGLAQILRFAGFGGMRS